MKSHNNSKKIDFYKIFCCIIGILSILILIGVIVYIIITIVMNPDVFSITIKNFKEFIKIVVIIAAIIYCIWFIELKTSHIKIKKTGVWFIDIWNS